jgi:hypothetical protein
MREFQGQFLALALRRAARGSGSSSAFLSRRTATRLLPDLRQILGPLPWVLVGGVALRAYMPERATHDIDILLHQRDSARACAALAGSGYTITTHNTAVRISAEQAGALPIDIHLEWQEWLDPALAAPSSDAAGYPVLGRPYLMLLKLQAGSLQDLTDVQRMLRDTPLPERVTTRALVANLDPALGKEFDALIALAEYEFGPIHGEP